MLIFYQLPSAATMPDASRVLIARRFGPELARPSHQGNTMAPRQERASFRLDASRTAPESHRTVGANCIAGNLGTPISRLAFCQPPIGRLAFPGDITSHE